MNNQINGKPQTMYLTWKSPDTCCFKIFRSADSISQLPLKFCALSRPLLLLLSLAHLYVPACWCSDLASPSSLPVFFSANECCSSSPPPPTLCSSSALQDFLTLNHLRQVSGLVVMTFNLYQRPSLSLSVCIIFIAAHPSSSSSSSSSDALGPLAWAVWKVSPVVVQMHILVIIGRQSGHIMSCELQFEIKKRKKEWRRDEWGKK